MSENIKLTSVNKYITCKLCCGYLIDAITVTECLHTFCKSCLVKYLSDRNDCPECNLVIHNSNPLLYCVADRTLQDIVYKMVPNLEQNEEERIKRFYGHQQNGRQQNSECQALDLSITSSIVSITGAPNTSNGTNNQRVSQHGNNANGVAGDEQVNVHLERIGRKIKKLDGCFVRCSANVTIRTMKKYISKQLYGVVDKFNDLDILCNGELLGKEHTLKFIYVTRWRFDNNKPLKLRYRHHVHIP